MNRLSAPTIRAFSHRPGAMSGVRKPSKSSSPPASRRSTMRRAMQATVSFQKTFGKEGLMRGEWNKGFLCGVARIVAMIARDFHEPDHAWNYLEETGRALDEFRAAGVDDQ